METAWRTKAMNDETIVMLNLSFQNITCLALCFSLHYFRYIFCIISTIKLSLQQIKQAWLYLTVFKCSHICNVFPVSTTKTDKQCHLCCIGKASKVKAKWKVNKRSKVNESIKIPCYTFELCSTDRLSVWNKIRCCVVYLFYLHMYI